MTVGQWQFTGEVITLESPPLPPVPNPKPKGAAKTAYNKAVTKAKAAQGKATERTALQHGVQEATQRLLDQAQSTGGVQIPNGITVNIWTTWHDHNDRNHTTFKFTNQGLCGGDCVGHAYATPTKTGLAGRLFNAHHDVIYGPKVCARS